MLFVGCFCFILEALWRLYKIATHGLISAPTHWTKHIMGQNLMKGISQYTLSDLISIILFFRVQMEQTSDFFRSNILIKIRKKNRKRIDLHVHFADKNIYNSKKVKMFLKCLTKRFRSCDARLFLKQKQPTKSIGLQNFDLARSKTFSQTF